MTPFGNELSTLRRKRKIQQQELAERLNVQPSYVSAMENGKKGPPSIPILNLLLDALELNPEEARSLEATIELSDRNLRLPESASLEEFKFLSELRKRVGSLSNEELKIMTYTLRLGGNSGREFR